MSGRASEERERRRRHDSFFLPSLSLHSSAICSSVWFIWPLTSFSADNGFGNLQTVLAPGKRKRARLHDKA